jgi:predicted nucleic acid-binding protein
MDVCCLNRPFDDLSQDRVKIESDAILSILEKCSSKEWTLITSKVVDIEISKIDDDYKKGRVNDLINIYSEKIGISTSARIRASELQEVGIKYFDGLHIALAEDGNAEIFLTTDDRLVRLAKKIHLRTKVCNPVVWLMEVLNNE